MFLQPRQYVFWQSLQEEFFRYLHKLRGEELETGFVQRQLHRFELRDGLRIALYDQSKHQRGPAKSDGQSNGNLTAVKLARLN